eukprot:symbB.v1.2.031225.t3/scaffold3600.1/size53445/5
MPPSRGRDMPWSPSMAHGVPPLRDPQGGMERVGRDPRLEDPYSVVDQRVPPPYAGDRGMGFDDFYDRGMGPMPADRRAAWRGGPPRLEGLDPWGRGPQIQIPPSPPGGRDPYGYDPGYDPGYPEDLYDRVPGHPHDDPGRSLGYPDRGPAYSPEDERHERAMRRSPGGEAWSGMGLDQALPKRGPVPNNVARMYDGPPGPAKAQPRSPPGPRAYEEHDYEPPQPAVPSKGGRASVRDPNAGEWGGHFGFGEEPAPPPKRPQRREAREPEEALEASHESHCAAGQGLFTTRRLKAGSLLLAVPAGRYSSPDLRALQAASSGSDQYQLPQALPPGDALRDVVLKEEQKEHKAAFAALLSDPRQWRSISAPRRLVVGEAELQSSELFFSLARLTRAPASAAFSIHGLINHSCEPNVQRTFATSGGAPWLLLRAAEDIEDGDELLDSYFFAHLPLTERRRWLSLLGPKATFECRCARCTAEASNDEVTCWSKLKDLVIQLAGLRGKVKVLPRSPGAEALPGIKDSLLLQPSAKQLLRQMEEILTPERLSSPSWLVGASMLADLQVAVEGDFEAAEATLGLAMSGLKIGSAAKLELAAVRSSYAATRVACCGGSLGSAIEDVKKCHEFAPGPSPGAWRGDVFDEGAKVPPMPRPGRASRPVGHSPERAEGFHDMIDMDVCDADDRDMEEEPERFKEPPPAATRPVPRARRQTPPADDGWGGQSLGDALAPKQATPSGGSTTTGAGGSSSSSVRSGGQKSTPSGAGSADPGKSPEWIMNWVRSLPESHVPEKTREHLADLIAEAQMNGRSFSDYVHKVPPEVCAPKHAMKLKAAWSNVLKEAEVAEMAAACAVRPAQKAMMIVV